MNTQVRGQIAKNVKWFVGIAIFSAICLFGIATVLGVVYSNTYSSGSTLVLESQFRNELTDKAVEIRISILKTIYQLALTFLGARLGPTTIYRASQ